MAELVRELEIWVHTLQDRPENNKQIKMEVGVEDALHIEFEYQRSKCVSSVGPNLLLFEL
mgnify:CR=1 FL=1